MYGISIYLQDLADVEKKVKSAAKLGFRLIFSSLHIPEENASEYLEKLKFLGVIAKKYHFELIMDISEESLSHIGLNYSDAYKISTFGVTGLRIDYGVSAEQIAKLSRQIKVYLNASTIDQGLMDDLDIAKVKIENIEAFHNYYPKPGTGLSESFFIAKNQFLQKKV